MLNLLKGRPIAGVRHNNKLKLIKLLEGDSRSKVGQSASAERSSDNEVITRKELMEIINDKRTKNDPFHITTEDDFLKEFGGVKALKKAGREMKIRKKMKERMKEISASADGKEINIEEGWVEFLPSEKRECVLFTGPSGSGKSYLCARYMRNFQKMFPDSKMFVLSRLNEDPSLDDAGIDFIRIPLDEEFIEDTPEMSDFPENSLILFDDISSLEHTHKKLFECVHKLQSEMLETGRHPNLYILVTNHMALNYKSTRMVLAESHKVVFYPHSGSAYAIKQYLRRYAGLNTAAINKFLNLPSRWAMFSTQYPSYVCHEKGVYLL